MYIQEQYLSNEHDCEIVTTTVMGLIYSGVVNYAGMVDAAAVPTTLSGALCGKAQLLNLMCFDGISKDRRRSEDVANDQQKVA